MGIYNDLIVNGLPLSEWGGASMIDYTVGEVELNNPYFLGVNRTTPILLRTFTGVRELELTIQFSGATLHDAKLQRSRFNSTVAGESEIYIPDDGFTYSCICKSLGAEKLVGLGSVPGFASASIGKVEAVYTFTAIRHTELIGESATPGTVIIDGKPVVVQGQINCLSTMPRTDCRLTVTCPTPASGTLYSVTVGGVHVVGVDAGDVLIVDGIKKRILLNGVSCAGSVDWSSWNDFPYLVPGVNEIQSNHTATVLIDAKPTEVDMGVLPDPVYVEYYPTYI